MKRIHKEIVLALRQAESRGALMLPVAANREKYIPNPDNEDGNLHIAAAEPQVLTAPRCTITDGLLGSHQAIGLSRSHNRCYAGQLRELPRSKAS